MSAGSSSRRVKRTGSPDFAAHAAVEPDAERYPFAAPDQYLVWQREDAALLLKYFERLYQACHSQDSPEASGRHVCPDA